MQLLKAAGKAALTIAVFLFGLMLLAFWPVPFLLFVMFALLTGAYYVDS